MYSEKDKEYKREYYRNNKYKWIRDTEEKKERHRQLSRESASRHRDKRDAKNKEWVENNYARVLFNQCRRGSKIRNLEFDLEINDIIIPEICPIFKFKLTSTQGKGKVWTNASVDRIDNSKGYIRGNIIVVSNLANSMKQHATLDQLKLFVQNIPVVYNLV